MEHARLKEILVYAPKKGVFYWISPPKGHSDLLGKEAGLPCNTRSKIYHIIQIDGRKWKRGYLAWLYMTGILPNGDVLDHKDGNSLNDKWENLRQATFLQNAQNRKTGKPNKILPMGVRSVKSGRFCARITVDGKQLSLGSFETPELAAAAYQEAREKYYAEFA